MIKNKRLEIGKKRGFYRTCFKEMILSLGTRPEPPARQLMASVSRRMQKLCIRGEEHPPANMNAFKPIPGNAVVRQFLSSKEPAGRTGCLVCTQPVRIHSISGYRS